MPPVACNPSGVSMPRVWDGPWAPQIKMPVRVFCTSRYADLEFRGRAWATWVQDKPEPSYLPRSEASSRGSGEPGTGCAATTDAMTEL